MYSGSFAKFEELLIGAVVPRAAASGKVNANTETSLSTKKGSSSRPWCHSSDGIIKLKPRKKVLAWIKTDTISSCFLWKVTIRKT